MCMLECIGLTCIRSLSLTLFCCPLLFPLSASFHHAALVDKFQLPRPLVHSCWIACWWMTLLAASCHSSRLAGQMSKFIISLWVPLLSPLENHSMRSGELWSC